MALETHLGHVVSFLDHLQPDHGLSLHSGLTVQEFNDLPCSLPSTGMVLSSQSPRLHLLHLLLGHTLRKAIWSLVVAVLRKRSPTLATSCVDAMSGMKEVRV